MCAFCNSSLVCVEETEGVFYVCSSSTSGRRLLILNVQRSRRGSWSFQESFCEESVRWQQEARLLKEILTLADWIGAGLIYFVLTRVDGSGGRISGVLITGVGIEVEGKGMNFMIVWYGYYGKWVTTAI